MRLIGGRTTVNGQVLMFLVAALAGIALTGGIRWLALRHRLLDFPNPRSAHATPVPLGGGAAIVMILCAWLVLMPFGDGASFVVALSGAAVAAIGFIDDSRTVSKWRRLVVHGAATALLIHETRHLGPLQIPGLPAVIPVQELCTLIALMWLLNLYNFMDGIDGLAAVEAVTVSLGLTACIYLGRYPAPDVLLACLVTAGASLGFLVWNWPPARIFMGDVGSGFLGFLLGALALVAHRETGLTPWVPAILLAVFVTDASITLLRRMIRGERWYESHRLHAYQWMSRRFGSHRPVTLIVLAVNLLWLAPLAIAAACRPEYAGLCAGVAYAPVVTGALLAGAGHPEADT